MKLIKLYWMIVKNKIKKRKLTEKEVIAKMNAYFKFRIKTCKDVMPHYKKEGFYDKVTECAREIQIQESSIFLLKKYLNEDKYL